MRQWMESVYLTILKCTRIYHSAHSLSVFPSRGLYLTSIFYRDDNVLVTSEDQIPIVEVEDSYSSSLMQDFLWFTKVDMRKTSAFLQPQKKQRNEMKLRCLDEFAERMQGKLCRKL